MFRRAQIGCGHHHGNRAWVTPEDRSSQASLQRVVQRENQLAPTYSRRDSTQEQVRISQSFSLPRTISSNRPMAFHSQADRACPRAKSSLMIRWITTSCLLVVALGVYCSRACLSRLGRSLCRRGKRLIPTRIGPFFFLAFGSGLFRLPSQCETAKTS